jgi:acyl-CoA dehydrogenase
MSDRDTIIVDTAQRIFRDLCDPQTLNGAKDESWKQPLWDALEESGLTLTWVSDEVGGAGADMMDGFDVLRVAGSYAVPVPLSETLLAGWLLEKAGITCPAGSMTIAPQREKDRIELGADGRLFGTARNIPFAGETGQIAIVAYKGDQAHVALVNSNDCQIQTGLNIALDPQGTVDFSGVTPTICEPAPVSADDLLLLGAAARASMIAGALEEAMNISVQYAQERKAFGRNISGFQAVQHNLSRLACEAAAAAAASGSAAEAIDSSETLQSDAMLLEVASAKIRCGEAAGQGAAIAHQAHGAIGFTQEHVLHRFTQRLWAWRDEFGSESAWAVRLGESVARNGADALWPLVASR